MAKSKKRFRKRFKLTLRRRRMMLAKGVSVLPHLFTLGNAFFGFVSIIFASRDAFVSASYCILMGALMDALDGRVARFFDVESPLGVELDSLCDAVTFCVAPSLLIYFSFLQELGPFGIIVCAIYILSGIFRLARFNIISDQQTIYFLGLPVTAAAFFLTALILNIKAFAFDINIAIMLLVVMLILSFLMAASVPFPSFKKVNFRVKPYSKMIVATVFAVMTIFKFKRMLLGLFISYFIWAIGLLFVRKRRPVKN